MKYFNLLINIIIIINNQPTVKVSCPVGYVKLRGQLSFVCLNHIFLGFSVCQICKEQGGLNMLINSILEQNYKWCAVKELFVKKEEKVLF